MKRLSSPMSRIAPSTILAALCAIAVALAIAPAGASADCEFINGTGEPWTPEQEAAAHEWEANCRASRDAAAAAKAQEEAAERANREAALASEEPCDALRGTEGRTPEFCVTRRTRWWRETADECHRAEAEGAESLIVAVCWRVVELQKARQRPKERQAERRQREWAHKPTVNARKARLLVEKRLQQDVEGWKHRRAGSVDCRGGRVDRTHWRCKVRWLYRVPGGERCRVGRFKVRGEGYRNGVAWYSTAGQWVNGYGLLDKGRIRCYA